ncbi:MAG: hypothetical protein ACRCZF_05790, partial [Gemmataceae bacterium]
TNGPRRNREAMTATSPAGTLMSLDTPLPGEVARLDQEVVEMPLLLPRWQASALEAAARRRGMTTGQMLRRVITDLFGPGNPQS